jgi:predicted Zn finger-like uncharacterized protein
MNFLCPSCKAKYKIADDKVAGRNHARMKCKKCEFIIEFRRQQNGQFAVSGSLDLGRPFSENPRPLAEPALTQQKLSPPRPTPPSAKQAIAASQGAVAISVHHESKLTPPNNGTAPGALAGYFKQSIADEMEEAVPPSVEIAEEWFIGLNNAPIGPLALDELKDRIVSGEVSAATLAWKEGFEEWQPIKAFPDFGALLSELPSPVAAPVAAVPVVQEAHRVVQIDAPSERMSWVAPKQPSKLPRYMFLGVAALLVGTIGFVVGKENPKPIVKYVEVPVNVPAQAVPVAIAPSEQKEVAQVDVAADTAGQVAAQPTQPVNKAAPSGEIKPEEPKPQPSAGGGLLSGLSGLQGGPAGPQSSRGEVAAAGNQLDADSVQRTVQRYSQSVRRSCWQPALDGRAQDAPSAARVLVTITVAGSGEVQNVSSEGDPKGYPGLSRCIEGKVRQWRFPASGGTTTVKVPFVFAAQ